MPFTAMAIGAGLGILKNYAVDAPKEHRQRVQAAETIRYSPWTHMNPNKIQEADPVGNALQFGASAGGMYNSAQGFQTDEALKNKMLTNMRRGRGAGSINLNLGSTPAQNPWMSPASNGRMFNDGWGSTPQYPAFQSF